MLTAAQQAALYFARKRRRMASPVAGVLFSDAFASGAIDGGWDSSEIQNANSMIAFTADPVLGGDNQCLGFQAGAVNGTTVGKAHLIKRIPPASRGSVIDIQFDILFTTQPATGLQVCDVETNLYSTNPGIRLGVNSDAWRVERSKIGLGSANTGVTSPDGAWQTVRWLVTLGSDADSQNKLYFDGVLGANLAYQNMPLGSPFDAAGAENVNSIQIGITSNSTAGTRAIAIKNFVLQVQYR